MKGMNLQFRAENTNKLQIYSSKTTKPKDKQKTLKEPDKRQTVYEKIIRLTEYFSSATLEASSTGVSKLL